MEQFCVPKLMLEKSTTNLATVFLTIFVGAMIIFVSPGLYDQAQAHTTSQAVSHYGPFSDVKGHMQAGKFLKGPTHGHDITWQTVGTNVIGGDERGYVSAKVGPVDDRVEVKFHFFNPNKGTNTCHVETPPTVSFHGTCHITQGTGAKADFVISPAN